MSLKGLTVHSLFLHDPLYVTTLVFILDLDIYEHAFFANDFIDAASPRSAWPLLIAL